MNKYLAYIFAAGVTALAATASYAEDSPHEFSANVALTSDYKFYGFSQTAEGWAIQGGFDYAHESGIYFGTWASSVDFVLGTSNPATIELDVYGGIGGELANGLSWDFGAVRYGYPNQNDDVAIGGDLEYWEVYANFGYTFEGPLEPSISAGIYVSPDWFGEAGTSIYPSVGLDLSLPNGFGFYGSVGYLDVDDIDLNYTHYAIGVSKDFMGLSFDFSWNDAEDDCGGDDFCQGFVFAVSKEF